jgi:PAS domain-containing protein
MGKEPHAPKDVELRELREALSSCQKSLTAAQDRWEKSERDRIELAAIVEGARDAIWSWRPDGTIVRWNAEAQRILGYAPAEIIGRSILDLVPEDRQEVAQKIMVIWEAAPGMGTTRPYVSKRMVLRSTLS